MTLISLSAMRFFSVFCVADQSEAFLQKILSFDWSEIECECECLTDGLTDRHGWSPGRKLQTCYNKEDYERGSSWRSSSWLWFVFCNGFLIQSLSTQSELIISCMLAGLFLLRVVATNLERTNYSHLPLLLSSSLASTFMTLYSFLVVGIILGFKTFCPKIIFF